MPANTPAKRPQTGASDMTQVAVARHPEGCVFCPAELLGLERDRNGDPLCQTCPHLRENH
jgi:hypothetical protein